MILFLEMIKVLGVGFNGTILICLLLNCILRKYGTHSTEVSLPTYLQRNQCALILVVNLCIIDFASVVVLYFILQALLLTELSSAETCAWKITAFCFINLYHHSTWLLGDELRFLILRGMVGKS